MFDREIVDPTYGGFFIDLSDAEVEGEFRWGDGQPVTAGWTNWAKGEPNDHRGAEDCTQVYGSAEKSWNDMPCDTKLFALCERLI